MSGRIIKGVGGFYYVLVPDAGIFECRARGIFRKDGQKPLVGDYVEMTITDTVDIEGSIIRLLPRKNELVRPAAANVDQALVIFAAADPDPNYNLLDRFLVMMEYAGVPVHLLINKIDLASHKAITDIARTYTSVGYPVHLISVREDRGIDEVYSLLSGRTSVVAGPSGVGKSSLINRLQNTVVMETGDVSRKLGRGRHTTRHSELIPLGRAVLSREQTPEIVYHNVSEGTFGVNAHFAEDEAHLSQSGAQPARDEAQHTKGETQHLSQDGAQPTLGDASLTEDDARMWLRYAGSGQDAEDGFIMDTPGFSSLYVPAFDKEALGDYFPEIAARAGECRFTGCAHIHEPDCAVRRAVEHGEIPVSRYDSYVQMYGELQSRKMW